MTRSHKSKVGSQRIQLVFSVTLSYLGLWIYSRLECYYSESLVEQDSCVYDYVSVRIASTSEIHVSVVDIDR